MNAAESTCSKVGNIAHNHCLICEKNFDEEGNEILDVTLEIGDHNLTEVEAKASTCVENGNIAYNHCTNCGKNYDNEGNELEAVILNTIPHELVDVEEKASTCSEKGNMAHKHCEVCGKNFDDDGNEIKNVSYATKSHNFVPNYVDATETCTLCGYEKSLLNTPYCLMGTLTNWSSGTRMYKTENSNVVYLPISLSKGTYEFKIKYNDTWYGNGGTIDNELIGGWPMGTSDGNCKFKAKTSGIYYFCYNTKLNRIYVISPDFNPESYNYGVCGTFTDWGSEPDAMMTYQGGTCWTVDIEISAGSHRFKVRQNEKWDINYGINLLSESDVSFTASVSGTYRFTIDFVNGIIKAELIKE